MRLSLIGINERHKFLMKMFLFVATFVGLITGPAIALWKSLVVVFVLYLVTGGWKFVYIVYRTVGRDLK